MKKKEEEKKDIVEKDYNLEFRTGKEIYENNKG